MTLTARPCDTSGNPQDTCEHHWVSHHQADMPVSVRQCSFCRKFDADDLRYEIARISIKAGTSGADAVECRECEGPSTIAGVEYHDGEPEWIHLDCGHVVSA